MSYIRSNAETLGIDPDFFRNSDIHVHIPSGAIPKDGPSAGITICIALISLLTSRPARRDVAMSGEITLSGRILPVSGIREKLLAAQRAGIKTVIFPGRNQSDVESCSNEVMESMQVVLAEETVDLVNVVLPTEASEL